jgi:hypothetical protein
MRKRGRVWRSELVYVEDGSSNGPSAGMRPMSNVGCSCRAAVFVPFAPSLCYPTGANTFFS